jgi:hypothetical protein
MADKEMFIKGMSALAVVVAMTTISTNARGIEPQRGDLFGTRVDDLIVKYGLPTTAQNQRGLHSYSWRFSVMTNEVKRRARLREHSCKVTVNTFSDGRIKRVRAVVSDAGAVILAASGVFGRLCLQGIGFKPL